MNADKGNKNLDELISGAIGREEPKFDFDKWKKSHQSEIQSFESQTGDGRISCYALLMNDWKAVLRTKAGRFAIAACLIVAMLIILRTFSSSIDGTTVAYAKMNEAVKNVPWMRITYTAQHMDPNGNIDRGPYSYDIWYSFNSKILIQRQSSGRITFEDYNKKEVYNYNPDSKRIVLSTLSGDTMPIPFGASSPSSWLESNIQQMIPFGGDVTRKEGQYNGQEVEIFEIVATSKLNVASLHSKIFVDKVTSLPIAEERVYINTNIGKPRYKAKGTFEFPQPGPADIYDLGLSRDVPIVDSRSLPPWEEIGRLYEPYRRKPPEQYIAVVTSELRIGNEPIESVDICYGDAVHLRMENHFLFQRGPIDVQWREQADEIGNTYDSILKWSQAFKTRGQIFISIFDKSEGYDARRHEKGTWETTKRRFSIEFTAESLWQFTPLVRIGWPQIRYADVIQDDYARQNNLIHLEAKGRQYYLNPDRDYICQIQVDEEGEKTEVKEFAQTKEGKWYPKRVEGPDKVKKIYLETNPVFPKGIFDPNELPKQDK